MNKDEDEIKKILVSISNTAILGDMFKDDPIIVRKTLVAIAADAQKGISLLESS